MYLFVMCVNLALKVVILTVLLLLRFRCGDLDYFNGC